jgi:hypothetical protein
VSGAGAGCNTLRGRFDVLEIVVGGNGKIERFAAEFEQHCEGGNAALFGSVRFNSTLRTQFQDCNDNGFHDARDIAEHFSMDSDGDGIPNECESRPFLRSNANADEKTDMADPIFILNYLFMGSGDPPCKKSSDLDDNGDINISDAIYLLRYLFIAGMSPAEPFSSCGPDPTMDGLTCESFPVCSGP